MRARYAIADFGRNEILCRNTHFPDTRRRQPKPRSRGHCRPPHSCRQYAGPSICRFCWEWSRLIRTRKTGERLWRLVSLRMPPRIFFGRRLAVKVCTETIREHSGSHANQLELAKAPSGAAPARLRSSCAAGLARRRRSLLYVPSLLALPPHLAPNVDEELALWSDVLPSLLGRQPRAMSLARRPPQQPTLKRRAIK